MDNIILHERLDRLERLLIANKEVLTFEETCDYTGISRSYLYKLTAAGTIPHSKPNGKLIFSKGRKSNAGCSVTKMDLRAKPEWKPSPIPSEKRPDKFSTHSFEFCSTLHREYFPCAQKIPMEKIPYLRVGTTYFKSVHVPSISGN